MIDLTLMLMLDCNLRCTYCYHRRFAKDVMPTTVAMDALTSAMNAGAGAVSLTFFGGEPLLEPGLMFEILGRARKLETSRQVPLTAKVSTNGLLLTEDVVEKARQTGLFISLSMDGIRESQDAGRKTAAGGSSFDSAQKALDLLAGADCPFAVYSVITPDNVTWFAESVEYFWDRGARIIVNTPDYTARWDRASLSRLRRQYRKAGLFYRRLLENNEYFHMEPFDSRISQVTRPDQWRRCAPGAGQVVAAPDGTLYGCIEYYHRELIPLGTASGWIERGRARQLAANKRPKPDACVSCGISTRCNNSCACANLRGTGHAGTPPRTQCDCERAAVLTVDSVASALYRRKVGEFLRKHYSCSYHLLTGIERIVEDMGVWNGQT